jgi:hypothetical protein
VAPARAAFLLSGLLVAIAMGRPLGAQRQSSLDIGFSLVEFPDDDAVVAGPWVGWRGRAESRRLFGSATVGGVGTVGSSTGFASLEGGALMPVARGWAVQGLGELYGVAGSSSRGAAAATASGRLLRVVGAGGAWVDGSATMSQRESGAMPAHSTSAGLWWSWPRARASAAITEQRAKAQLFTGPFRDQLMGTIPVRYTEGKVELRVESDRATLDLSAGARRDVDAAQLVEPTFGLTGAFWASATRAWVVSYSRELPDYVRGGDATRWFAIGMRFNEATPLASRALRTKPTVVLLGAGDTRVVRVRAPAARRVEVMADFTDWEPVELTRSGATFERKMAVESGTHRMAIRIDGGAWRPAANTPAVDDDLGGRVGLLVVD